LVRRLIARLETALRGRKLSACCDWWCDWCAHCLGFPILLDGDVPLTDRAHPYVFLRKRDERHPADLEPGSRLSAGDGSVMAPGTDPRSLLSFWVDFGGASENDRDAKKEIHL